MKLTVDNFFRSIQDRLDSRSIDRPDHNPNNYEHIKNLFQKFLTHNDRFGDCDDLNGLSCPAKDGTGDYLYLQTDPTNFGMRVGNKGKNTWYDEDTEIPWVGSDLHCSREYVESDDLRYSNYHCMGNLPDSHDSSYSLLEQIGSNARCRETYFPPNAGHSSISFDECKNLPLFDQFLKNAPFQEISPLSRAWSQTKFGIGIVSTLYCAAETLQEIQKILNPLKVNSEKPLAAKQPPSLKEKATVPIAEQNKAAIEAAKKRALIYGTATIASAIFTAITYATDFADVYHTHSGLAGRFTNPSI